MDSGGRISPTLFGDPIVRPAGGGPVPSISLDVDDQVQPDILLGIEGKLTNRHGVDKARRRIEKFCGYCREVERAGIDPARWGWRCLEAYELWEGLSTESLEPRIAEKQQELDKRIGAWRRLDDALTSLAEDNPEAYEAVRFHQFPQTNARGFFSHLHQCVREEAFRDADGTNLELPKIPMAQDFSPSVFRDDENPPRKPTSTLLKLALFQAVAWLVHGQGDEPYAVQDACGHVGLALHELGCSATQDAHKAWTKVRDHASSWVEKKERGTLAAPYRERLCRRIKSALGGIVETARATGLDEKVVANLVDGGRPASHAQREAIVKALVHSGKLTYTTNDELDPPEQQARLVRAEIFYEPSRSARLMPKDEESS